MVSLVVEGGEELFSLDVLTVFPQEVIREQFFGIIRQEVGDEGKC